MRLKKLILPTLTLSLIIFRLVRLIPLAFSQSTAKDIAATVKASVCGNEIIEGNEDCEGDNLNNQTCAGLGYTGGTLSCDVACSFDISDCLPAPTATPTPTPTNTPTPTLTPTPTATLTPTPTVVAATSTPAPAATNTPGPAATSTPAPAATATPSTALGASPVPAPAIPAMVLFFDFDKSGKIEITEVFVAVKSWVEEWRQAVIEEIAQGKGVTLGKKERKCDLNKDYRCDLRDFSVLLFYVEG